MAGGRAGGLPRRGPLAGPAPSPVDRGPTDQVPWTSQALAALCTRVSAHLRTLGGSLLVTTSRRTPGDAIAALRAACAGLPHLLWCDERDGPNPYAGLLGWADAIVASADSVNLLSEACATRVPVAAAFAEQARGRVDTYLQALRQRQRLHPVDEVLASAVDIVPVRETERIAMQVRARLLP